MISRNAPFKPGYPRITPERFESVMEQIGSPWADKARSLYQLIADGGHDPAVWLAIGIREHRLLTDPDAVALKLDTNSWTNARSVILAGLEFDIVTTFDLRRAGITNRDGPYVRYRSVEDSLRDGMWRVDDPAYVYQQSGAVSIADVLSIWTESEAADYIRTTVDRINEWDVPMSLTERIRDRIAAKGVEVHDIRDRMIEHASLRYRRLPNEAWLYTGVHHTGVSRGVRSLQGDIDSWVGHSRHHVDNNGWPGIAYAVGVSQSGRAFILRDVELEGYHAFNANANTLAVCGDLGDGNAPTAALKNALIAVLHVLHFETPELTALRGYQQTYGHQELKFIDARNSTGCPGRLLPIVHEYRAGAYLPDAGTPAPRVREFDNGYTLRDGFLAFYERAESSGTHWSTIGVPIGPEIPEVFNGEGPVTVQQTDIGFLQWTPATGEVRMATAAQARVIRKSLGMEEGRSVNLAKLHSELVDAINFVIDAASE